jgi:hypothetical protein
MAVARMARMIVIEEPRPPSAVGVHAVAWVAALVTFAWIVSVAITKSPLGVLALLRP